MEYKKNVMHIGSSPLHDILALGISQIVFIEEDVFHHKFSILSFPEHAIIEQILPHFNLQEGNKNGY